MSILSQRKDGMGCYYGRMPGDSRLINVLTTADYRKETNEKLRMMGESPDVGPWTALVGDDRIGMDFPTKEAAELAAIEWIKTVPEDE